MVISYILFNVLDLDGSDLCRVFGPVEKSTIVAVEPAEGQLFNSPEQFASGRSIFLLITDVADKFASQHQAMLLISQLKTARSHGYRVSLARNSLPDSSPYF